MYLIERFGFGMPLAIRMEQGGGLLPLHQVMADFVLGKLKQIENCHLDWLSELALPPVLVYPLIDICRKEMETVLRFIGSRADPIGPFYYGERRVKVHDTRRILKIARETQEQAVLRGAAAVLVNATFARLAEPELVKKIVVASSGSPFVLRVFGTHDSIRGRDEEPKLRELAREVAAGILEQPEMHPFSVVNRAAVFLAEVEAVRNVPLFEEYPELELASQE